MGKIAVSLIASIFLLGLCVPGHAVKPRRWLRTQRCELMLSPQVQGLQGDHNYLSAVHGAMAKLGQNVLSGLAPVNYDPLIIKGSLSRMSAKRRNESLARLNGIEQSLMAGHPDMQIAAVELRGAEINEALLVISQLEGPLAEEYRRIKKQADGGIVYKLVNFAAKLGLRSSGLFSLYLFSYLPLFSDHPVSGFFHLLGFSIMPFVNFIDLTFDKFRFDREHGSLLKHLQEVQGPQGHDLFYHAAASLLVPAEFSRMIFNSEDPDLVQDGRRETHNLLGRSFFHGFLGIHPRGDDDTEEHEMKRMVANAGSTLRHAYLDYVSYYDDEAEEPVLLFVYRSYNDRPQGSKPPRQEKQGSEAEDWDRGLKPVGT